MEVFSIRGRGLLLGERIVVGEVFYLCSLQALWSVAGPSPLGDAIFEVDLKAGQLSLPVTVNFLGPRLGVVCNPDCSQFCGRRKTLNGNHESSSCKILCR